MLWINIKRILRSGFISFWRNGVVSLSSILVMIITLFVISTVIFTSALLTHSLESVKDKVDININFQTNIPEDEVLELKRILEELPEVASVEYLTDQQVLIEFQEENQDNQVILDSLSEVGENPFGASIRIKAIEPSQYEGVSNFLNENYQLEEGNFIKNVNFEKKKEVIDKLTQVISASESLGAILSIIFILISIIITFNTIRLAMFISRDEVHVMKMVGADLTYIQGPFVIAGSMYGMVGAVITLILLLPITYWTGELTSAIFNGLNIFNYYISSFLQMFLIIFFSGIFIGAVSSFWAIKRYLKTK